MPEIAIVIPAYKPDYLADTLESIARQTCLDFRVYVGDDASPYDIKSVVDAFSERMDISYTRFDENLGGKDLVAQWVRCVGLAQSEEWIWLFSDDDMMEPCCVSSFIDIDKTRYDVIHFDIDIIDSEGCLVRHCNPYPAIMSSAEFYSKIYRHEIDARMPEFVFRASAIRTNGFVKFDLAWRSDNATVMLNAANNGIATVSGDRCHVLWRASKVNVSADTLLRERKNAATVEFFNWAYSFFSGKSPLSIVYQLKTILFEFVYSDKKTFRREAKSAGRRLKYASGFNRLIYLVLTEYRIFYRRYDT